MEHAGGDHFRPEAEGTEGKVEEAADGERRRGSAGGGEPELVADLGAEVLREVDADDDVERPDLRRSGDDLPAARCQRTTT
jgi:hypothetical protein